MISVLNKENNLKRNKPMVRLLMIILIMAFATASIWYASNLLMTNSFTSNNSHKSGVSSETSSEPTPTGTSSNPTLPTPTAMPTITVTFDFDTGAPGLTTFRNTPFEQTKDGVTAYFSSPGVGLFSVQSSETLFLKLSLLSGNFLGNKNVGDILEIKFNQQITSITFTFATFESHGAPDQPSSIMLTAYIDSATSTPVGTATAHGTWPTGGDSYPQGTLTYNSDKPFNLVRIMLPYQGTGRAAYFLIDNITVKTI